MIICCTKCNHVENSDEVKPCPKCKTTMLPLFKKEKLAEKSAADYAVNSFDIGEEAKQTKGKPDFTLVPTEIIYEIEKVRQYGIKKYKDPENYKTVPPIEFKKAFIRHALRIMAGEEIDPESGLSHWSHAATNIDFYLELTKNKGDKE